MPSPFPGMDPYLEGRTIWPDLHHGLITAIRDALAPQVAPGYYVRIEQRTYIVEVDGEERIARPDVTVITASSETEPPGEGQVATAVAAISQTVTLPQFEEIRQGYLEIREVQTHEVITVIELLSPSNKVPGEGRKEYEAKRRHVLCTLTNFVEIDLLRAGEPLAMKPRPKSDYRILVRAEWEGSRARLYAFGVRQPIPEVPVPLRYGEKEARLALGRLLSEIYERARYDLSLDYHQPPEPPLSSEDAPWAEELLRANRLRP
ncbi:MAG: DUF4058 family protein [Candidatus Tectomicrobia bacterium]|uniref:DUF4058 family protein n=1 Tax=Tectimicrobiota bacterium TaxID=2528274 RepID=A0A932CNM9_UNCTE|nr:DUF4058 family protein [Candidatus Tectomicrobia bacterium]